jgi:hypothetical protein
MVWVEVGRGSMLPTRGMYTVRPLLFHPELALSGLLAAFGVEHAGMRGIPSTGYRDNRPRIGWTDFLLPSGHLHPSSPPAPLHFSADGRWKKEPEAVRPSP